MKQAGLFIAIVVLLFGLTACVQQDKSIVLSQYKYEDDSDILAVKVNRKLEPWVAKGVECYGIIMVCDKADNPLRMKEVHVKVIDIQPKSVKMEVLEDVIINRTMECLKISLKKGQSWYEEYGDIFKTREEAIRYIDEQYPGLRVRH